MGKGIYLYHLMHIHLPYISSKFHEILVSFGQVLAIFVVMAKSANNVRTAVISRGVPE